MIAFDNGTKLQAQETPQSPSFDLHLTKTSSVLYRCVMEVSFSSDTIPELYMCQPAWAIMMPLSMQNLMSVAKTSAPRSLHISPIISCRRTLHPTPPHITTS